VVASRVEKQPAAALVVAPAQAVCGHRLQEVKRVQREDRGQIARVACLERPPRRGASEAAGGDCASERLVQWRALPCLVFATGLVDAIGQVLVQLLSELPHLTQDTVGRLRVVSHSRSRRAEKVRVRRCGAADPGQQVEWDGEVLAVLVGVMAPGHGVDEIKREVAADEVD
jgi:hypothetical protein